MKRSYRDRDYDFGQRMLNLRSAIGLTQTGLAEYLGISRFAVGEWEAGNKYPKAEHLKSLVELAVQQTALSAGREADEIRALWKAARQKVLLDEHWLHALLATPSARRIDNASVTGLDGTRVDWGDALAIPHFYGREWEINLLTTWVLEKQCRVVSTLGLGGIGKSVLVVTLMRQIAEHFEVVVWRSLRDAPECATFVDIVLQVLDPTLIDDTTMSLEQRFSLLLNYLHNHRVLLVFDNLESILEEKDTLGQMRQGYEGYGTLLRRIAETEHQSCLLLTSREKPGELVSLEGRESPVRSLRLTQLDINSCQELLAEKGIPDATAERTQLIERYGGNPLALKIVSQTIVDLFDGEIAPFLQQGEIIFGGVHELLNRQFNRLSPLEQRILVWLAILREPATLTELSSLLVTPVQRMRLLEAMDALHRRSLIERGQYPGTFTLQSVVLDSVITFHIARVSVEINHGQFDDLREYGLELARAQDYVRHTQERLVLTPILAQLRESYPNPADLETVLIDRLNELRTLPEASQGYVPANLIALLRVMRGHLKGLDLSRLVLRNVYLQGVDMQDTNLSHSELRDCTFTETFEALNSLSISQNGSYWVANSIFGQILVWEADRRSLHRLWEDTAAIERTAISPDGSLVAGGYEDGNVKLWDVASGALLWSSGQVGQLTSILALQFSPDGNIIAVTGNDSVIRLWHTRQGHLLAAREVASETGAIAWRSDSALIATGDMAGAISLWSIGGNLTLQGTQIIRGHEQNINALTFSPDGNRLASASWDHTVKIWDAVEGQLQETLTAHQSWVQGIAWSADGRTLASSERDGAIFLWDVEGRRYRAALRGHSGAVKGLAFTPDSKNLVSTSWDATLRVWAVDSGRSVGVHYGYNRSLIFLEWSPDGSRVAVSGNEPLVMIYDLNNPALPRLLHGLKGWSGGLAWSPDGRWLASSDTENLIYIWDTTTEQVVASLSDTEEPDNAFSMVAWHPQGQYLAAGTYFKQAFVHCFDMKTSSYSRRDFESVSEDGIGQVVWSPDGAYLVGWHRSSTLYVWDVNGALHQKLSARDEAISAIDWSADGRYLATLYSSGHLFIWDRTNWTFRHVLKDLPGYATITWGTDDDHVIICGSDGVLRWWDVRSGEFTMSINSQQGIVNNIQISPDRTMLASCGDDGALVIRDARTGELLKTLRLDRPYERMDITGIKGLTEAQTLTLRQLGAVEDNSV